MAKKLHGHYTTLSGLKGIIDEEELWATNIKFLNDEHEFQHALELIQQIIPKAKLTPKDAEYSLLQDYTERLNKELSGFEKYHSDSVFTLSFSEETDLLSQWRGYCPENNGYCLQYDLQQVFDATKSLYPDSHLVKCVYDDKQKETQIKKLLNDKWSLYKKLKTDKEKRDLLAILRKDITLLASYFKHPSFQEEKEHRIVVFLDYAPEIDLRFREGRFSLIPYVALPAPRKAMKKICIGPTAHKNLAYRALEMFLDKAYGVPMALFGAMDISFSDTPYRPW